MCSVCGCGDHGHTDAHTHAMAHTHGNELEFVHAPGLGQSRMVQIEQDILSWNNRFADANRERLEGSGTLALNLVSSPGSGKTTLLVRTIEALRDEADIAVIVGDQQTANDADRIGATGVPAIQINTGRGCHLDGHQVGHALDDLGPAPKGVLFIENVGNLVCPAAFDLGEAHKVAILSVTEGEDKPLKYPDMFAASDLMLIGKTDLLPYVDFDVARCVDLARRVNPGIEVLPLSAKTGEGMDRWLDWIRSHRHRKFTQDSFAELAT